MKTLLLTLILICSYTILYAQQPTKSQKHRLDSLYIEKVEDAQEPEKVLHAEPLYIDLIRDLGARKGEKEWNLGMGITDNLAFDTYEALIEYEFAPIDRLGLEIELPFLFYSSQEGINNDSIPSDRLESLKLAGQWSFFVSEEISTSMAFGYIHEFEFSDFENFGNPLIKGNVYNPFFIAAKRWGNNFHTLIYTGPRIEHTFNSGETHSTFEINLNFHYMVSGTRNFLGIELNQEIDHGDFVMVMRPQMRLEITETVMIGIVGGIPVDKREERLSSFFRLIWEPQHKG